MTAKEACKKLHILYRGPVRRMPVKRTYRYAFIGNLSDMFKFLVLLLKKERKID